MSKDKARPSCPFGKDCFYQHRNDDGTTYIFPDGVDKSMRVGVAHICVIAVGDT